MHLKGKATYLDYRNCHCFQYKHTYLIETNYTLNLFTLIYFFNGLFFYSETKTGFQTAN